MKVFNFSWIIAACLCVLSCNNIDTSKGNSFQLKFNPKANSTFIYSTTTKTKITQTINDKEQSSESNVASDLKYEIQKESLGIFKIKTTYESFIVKLKVNDEERLFDASKLTASNDIQERIFSCIKGATTTANVDSNGKIISIDNSYLKNKVNSIISNNPSSTDNLSGSLKQFLDDSYYKESMEANFKAFPDKPIKPGDSWTASSQLTQGLNIGITTKYTLDKIEDGIAYIEMYSNIDNKNQPLNIQGMTVDASLKGEQIGFMKIEIASGLPIENRSAFKLDGKMFIRNIEIPISIHSEINSKAKNRN